MKTKTFTIMKSLLCKTFWYLFILQALFIIYSVAPKKCDPIITLAEDFIYLSGPNIMREGEESSSYKVSIKEAFAQDINISLYYSGTAEENIDYSPIKELVIKKGELFSEFKIKTLDDPYAEYNEEIAIKIASVNGESFLNSFKVSNPDNVIYTKILDEKNPKHKDKDTINITLQGKETLFENDKKNVYTVNLSQVAVEDIDLNISFEGTASFGIDYDAPKNITVKKGQKSANFSITLLNDIYKEGTESLKVSISDFDDIGYEDIRYDTSEFNIELKDDVKPVQAFIVELQAQKKAIETEEIHYTLKTKQALQSDITLVFNVTSKDSNTYNEKVHALMRKGTKETKFTLRVKDDNILEKKQFLKLDLDSVENNAYERVQLKTLNAQTKIYDNKNAVDKGAQLTLSLVNNTTIYEDSKEFTVVVQSSQTLLQDLVCTLKYTGNAENKKDFIAPRKIKIKKGQDKAQFSIKLINDNLIESEKIIIELSPKGNGGFEKIKETKAFTIKIEDEKTPSLKQAATLSFSGIQQIAEGKKATYLVTLSQKLEKDLNVNFSYNENGAKIGEDFIATKTFTLEKGLKKKKFFLETVNNDIAENIESFTISVDSLQGGGLENIVINKSKQSVSTSITDEIDIVNEFKKIVVKQKILFEYAKDSLDSKSFTALDDIVLLLQKFPKALLTVEGHTDSSGNKQRNQKLSKRRANSVTNYLLEKGISSSRLKSIGYGLTRPMVPDSNPNASKLNKRVEFKVKYEDQI